MTHDTQRIWANKGTSQSCIEKGFLVETVLGSVTPDGHLIDGIPRDYRFFKV